MKTLVIGEVGNNHESKDDIQHSIEFLRSRGCLIKFQAFDRGDFSHLDDYVLGEGLIAEIAAPDVFYSVFKVKKVGFLEKAVNPKYYKLASRSFGDDKLIEEVKRTGKRVFASVPWGRIPPYEPFMFLHCVSTYPAPCAHLRALEHTRIKGLSDHTTSTLVPALAVTLGAKVIEKHFKCREMDTPDSKHSLLPGEWDKMLEGIREAEWHVSV